MERLRGFLPYLAILMVISCIAIAILSIVGPSIGNVFSPILNYDCSWGVEARTWLDQNENGIWEDQELPLPDVTVKLLSDYAEEKTNTEGMALLDQHASGLSQCESDVIVKVSAVEPPGSRLTTPQVITGTWKDRKRFQFGFVRISINTTPTPPSTSQ